jgi:hypothetical protein
LADRATDGFTSLALGWFAAGVETGDVVGCFQVVAELGVVDGEPSQVAEGGFELIGQPVPFAAQPGVLAGQIPRPIARLILSTRRGRAVTGSVADLGGDIAEVPPEGGVAQPEAACQGALARAAGVPDSRADELLARVGLQHAARQRAGGYSLGMRQRLGLAATLLGNPQVLILDEPANGLDPHGIRWLRDLLHSLAAGSRAVLVSSHVLAEVAQTVDDVVVISGGRSVLQAPLERMLAGHPAGVRAAEPDAQLLGELLRAEGAHVVGRPAGIVVRDRTIAEIGRMVATRRLAISELSAQPPLRGRAAARVHPPPRHRRTNLKPGCTQTAGKTSSSWDCCNPSTCPRRRLPVWRDPVMHGHP